MNEIWKPVLGYEGLYEVSSLGSVRNLTKGWIIKGHVNKNSGYQTLAMRKNNIPKAFMVNRLVMEAFHGKSPLVVHHKNDIKTDNRLENLEYVSDRVNAQQKFISKNGEVKGYQYYNKIFYSRIRVGKKVFSLGKFDTAEEATAAYFHASDVIDDIRYGLQINGSLENVSNLIVSAISTRTLYKKGTPDA